MDPLKAPGTLGVRGLNPCPGTIWINWENDGKTKAKGILDSCIAQISETCQNPGLG